MLITLLSLFRLNIIAFISLYITLLLSIIKAIFIIGGEVIRVLKELALYNVYC